MHGGKFNYIPPDLGKEAVLKTLKDGTNVVVLNGQFLIKTGTNPSSYRGIDTKNDQEALAFLEQYKKETK